MSSISLQIAGVLAPSIVLVLIGLAWFHKGPEFPVPFVTTLVMNICLPALLFHTLVNASVPINSLSSLALAALCTQVILALIAIALLRLAGKDWRLCTVHVVGNTGNLGLPVCLLAFGDEGLAYAITFFRCNVYCSSV